MFNIMFTYFLVLAASVIYTAEGQCCVTTTSIPVAGAAGMKDVALLKAFCY